MKKLPTLIIRSLALLNNKNIAETEKEGIQQELTSWLIAKRKDDWNFNNDLLVVFIALSALLKIDSEILTGEDLSKIISQLIQYESQEGGPYYSNLINKNINLETNIAIAYFLSLNKIELPNITTLINNSIYQSKHSSLVDLLDAKLTNQPKNSSNTTSKEKDEMILKKILAAASLRFECLASELGRIATLEIKRTMDNNKDKQMSLISYYFKLALGSAGEVISDDFVTEAGLANIFFWTAFIIYDDFWDEDERAIPSILPTANLYARHYIDFYLDFAKNYPDFKVFFHNLMDKLDAANTWETLHCRTKVVNFKFTIPNKIPEYDDYTLKFQPTSGQVLGPVAILIKLGFKLNSPEVQNLINYFKNYLIAMQINDDAHDLIEDLGRGHLSTVVVMFLADWRKKYPESKEIDLVSDLPKIQKLFWFKTIRTASLLAIDFTKESRKYLKALTLLEDASSLEYFINITENIAQKALREQSKSLDFLEEFK